MTSLVLITITILIIAFVMAGVVIYDWYNNQLPWEGAILFAAFLTAVIGGTIIGYSNQVVF